MTGISDFTSKDGKIDWEAYRRARVAAGEECHRCGGYIFTMSNQGRRLCSECKSVDDPDKESHHSSMVRCPRCKEPWDVTDGESLGGWSGHQEDEFSVWCSECDHSFDISIEVQYTFVSPKCD